MIGSDINVKVLVTVAAVNLVCTCLYVYTKVSGTEFILFLVILKEKDVGSGGKKNTLHNFLLIHSFAFYIDDSCRIIQENKDLRTLNNVTGLFDGVCVCKELVAGCC